MAPRVIQNILNSSHISFIQQFNWRCRFCLPELSLTPSFINYLLYWIKCKNCHRFYFYLSLDLKTYEFDSGPYRKKLNKMKKREIFVGSFLFFFLLQLGNFFALSEKSGPMNPWNRCFHLFSFVTDQLDIFPGICCQKSNPMSGKFDYIQKSCQIPKKRSWSQVN